MCAYAYIHTYMQILIHSQQALSVTPRHAQHIHTYIHTYTHANIDTFAASAQCDPTTRTILVWPRSVPF